MWEPGEPLYLHPTEWSDDDTGCPRPMIDVFEDIHDYRVILHGRCLVCEDPAYAVHHRGLVWSKVMRGGR